MSFKDVKHEVLKALISRSFQHEVRARIDVKNKLALGEISAGEVADIIKQSRGNEYTTSPHHSDQSINVHIITTKKWYIKFYFLNPDAWFISVHENELEK